MEDSGAILFQISVFKDMLDQVNEEIEANIQITRAIESEIVKCSEMEAALSVKESDLTKVFFASQFEINGLVSVTADSRKSMQLLEEEFSCLRRKRDAHIRRLSEKREVFVKMCNEFQRDISVNEDNEIESLLSEREFLENEIKRLEEKNDALENSILAYMEDETESLGSEELLDFEVQLMDYKNSTNNRGIRRVSNSNLFS